MLPAVSQVHAISKIRLIEEASNYFRLYLPFYLILRQVLTVHCSYIFFIKLETSTINGRKTHTHTHTLLVTEYIYRTASLCKRYSLCPINKQWMTRINCSNATVQIHFGPRADQKDTAFLLTEPSSSRSLPPHGAYVILHFGF